MADQVITNQCAHIRDLIKNSAVPMSYAEISASPGIMSKGLGTSLNRMVKIGHLIRTGTRNNYRYTFGKFSPTFKCASEEERQERNRARWKRRREKERLARGGKTREQRRAEKEARIAQQEAARVKRQKEAAERKAADAARIKARIEKLALLEAQRDERKKQKVARLAEKQAPKPKRSKPANQQLVIGPGDYSPKPVAPQREAIEQYLKRGGKIQKLPGLKQSDSVAPRRPVVQFRGVQAI